MKTFFGIMSLVCSISGVHASTDVVVPRETDTSGPAGRSYSAMRSETVDAVSSESVRELDKTKAAPSSKRDTIVVERDWAADLLEDAAQKGEEFSVSHYKKYVAAFDTLLTRLESDPDMDVEQEITEVHQEHNACSGRYS